MENDNINHDIVQYIININEQLRILNFKVEKINNNIINIMKENEKTIGRLCQHEYVQDYNDCNDRTQFYCKKCKLYR